MRASSELRGRLRLLAHSSALWRLGSTVVSFRRLARKNRGSPSSDSYE
jgi:hypothetical protein